MEGCENRLLPSCLLRAAASQTLPARTPRGARGRASGGARGLALPRGGRRRGKGRRRRPCYRSAPRRKPRPSQLRPSADRVRAPGTKLPRAQGLPPSSGALPARYSQAGLQAEQGARGPRGEQQHQGQGHRAPRRPRLREDGHRARGPRRVPAPVPRSQEAPAGPRSGRLHVRHGPGTRRAQPQVPAEPPAPQVRKDGPASPRASASRHTARPAGSPEPARLCHAPGPDPRPGPAPRPDPAPTPPRPRPQPASGPRPQPSRSGSSQAASPKSQVPCDRGTNSDGPRTQAPVFTGQPAALRPSKVSADAPSFAPGVPRPLPCRAEGGKAGA